MAGARAGEPGHRPGGGAAGGDDLAALAGLATHDLDLPLYQLESRVRENRPPQGLVRRMEGGVQMLRKGYVRRVVRREVVAELQNSSEQVCVPMP